MSKEAMKLALEALKQIDEAMPFPVAKLAQAALREALAEQPAQQEPVATLFGSLPVYDTSPPAQRKPLTDEQVWNNDELMKLNAVMMLPMDYFMRVVRAIESAHGIKENT